MLSSLARSLSLDLAGQKRPIRVPSFNDFNAGVDGELGVRFLLKLSRPPAR